VEAALDLLRDRALTMAQIAAAVGVADAAALHHLIRRATGQPPQAFRSGPAARTGASATTSAGTNRHR
jgi:transcriptional regulator GlxA family with amidase domain